MSINKKEEIKPFTFESYANIIAILSEYLTLSSFEHYNIAGRLFLRHDIDISIYKALEFAEFESSLGIQSTYFVQPNSDFYNLSSCFMLESISKIVDYGHMIGLHIDANDSESLNVPIEEYIEEQFNFYKKYFKLTKVVSFHRPPKNVIGKMYFQKYINTYSNEYFSDIRYFSDSKRRNFIPDLFKSFNNDKETSIQLLVHPIWWSSKCLNINEIYHELLINEWNLLNKALIRNISPFKYLSGFEI